MQKMTERTEARLLGSIFKPLEQLEITYLCTSS